MIISKIKIFALASLIGASTMFAGTISGSPHDLSGTVVGDNGELCVYCHTPHAANTAFTGAPLWNKASPTGTFTMYGATAAGVAGTTIAGTSTAAQPASASLACLSCHDGVSAIDSIVNAPGSGMGSLVTGSKTIVDASLGTLYGGNIGGIPGGATGANPDLTNDHPVSIVYTEGAAGLRLKSFTLDTAGGDWIGATTVQDLLRGADQVECGSCHDPHNGGKTQGTDTEVNFLRHSNASSHLCLGCHDK